MKTKPGPSSDNCAAQLTSDTLLWNLYGTTYDLEAFCENHPGGDLAIRLAQGGHDATQLFESYHLPTERHTRLLEKYRVGSPKTQQSAAAKSKFRNDLEKMLVSHFQLKSAYGPEARHAYKATWFHHALCLAFLVLHVVAIVGWSRGSVMAMFALPFTAWVLACNSSHDASHLCFSNFALVNEIVTHSASPFFYNAVTWYYQHIISHHTSTNEVDNDVDLQHFAPMKLSPHDHLVKNGDHALVDYLKVLATGVHLAFGVPLFAQALFPKNMVDFYFEHYKPAIIMPSGLERSPRYRLSNLCGPILAVIFLVLPFFQRDTVVGAFVFSLVPFMIASVIFLVVTQSSHIQPEAQVPRNNEPDFWKWQAQTSVDYSVESYFWAVATGGLNMQALHHCLPHVSSCHYAALYPKFEAVCAAHGIIIPKRRNLAHSVSTCVQHVWSLNNSSRFLLFSDTMLHG
jgi:fatty acid desaturase